MRRTTGARKKPDRRARRMKVFPRKHPRRPGYPWRASPYRIQVVATSIISLHQETCPIDWGGFLARGFVGRKPRRMTDRIIIRDLRVRAVVGVNRWEKAAPQVVGVDLEIGVDAAKAAAADEIAATVDYKRVSRDLAALAESRSFELIETLAEEIASLVLEGQGADLGGKRDGRASPLRCATRATWVWSSNGVQVSAHMRASAKMRVKALGPACSSARAATSNRARTSRLPARRLRKTTASSSFRRCTEARPRASAARTFSTWWRASGPPEAPAEILERLAEHGNAGRPRPVRRQVLLAHPWTWTCCCTATASTRR